MNLAEDGADTILRYTAKADVGGKLAQIGSRLIQGTAKKMADDFFGKFSAIVGESYAAERPAAPPAAATTWAAPAAEAAPAQPSRPHAAPVATEAAPVSAPVPPAPPPQPKPVAFQPERPPRRDDAEGARTHGEAGPAVVCLAARGGCRGHRAVLAVRLACRGRLD